MTPATTVLRTPEALVALAPEWAELHAASDRATPFQSPAFLLSCWKLFAPGELAAIAVREGRDLIGLAPVYVETSERGRRLVPVGLGPADHLDLLVRPDRSGPALDLIAAVMADICDRWEFDDLLPRAALRDLPVPHGFDDETRAWRPCPVLHLRPEGSEPLSAVPARRRRKWRMARHRAERAGGASIRPVPAEEIGPAIDRLVAWIAERRTADGEPSSYADPRLVDLLIAAARALARSDGLAAYALSIGDMPAGVFLGFRDRRAFYAYACGFDARFADLAPGTLLIGHAVMEATRAGAAEFCFLRGRERYKTSWGAEDVFSLRRVVRRTSR